MDLIWKKDATKCQKLAGMLFLLGFIGPIVTLFLHNFYASERTFVFSAYISIACTAITGLFLIYVYRFKGIRNKQIESYSKIKKTLVFPLMPIVLYGYYWMNFGVAIPQAITGVKGQERTVYDYVWKDYSATRSGCRFRLGLSSPCSGSHQ